MAATKADSVLTSIRLPTSTKHSVADCRRPRKDALANPAAKAKGTGKGPPLPKAKAKQNPKGGGKGKSQGGGGGGATNQQAQPKGQAKKRAQSQPKSKPKAKASSHQAEAEAGLMEVDWAGRDLYDPPAGALGSEDVPFTGCISIDNFAHACTFYTTFQPSFHSSENADANGSLPPILDTGATHCLPPLKWLHPKQAANSKRTHLKVASGTSVRALLYNNFTVSRATEVDARLAFPLGLPVVSNEELYALLRAIHLYTETGQLWDARQWSQQLGRKLSPYHWGTTTTTLPKDQEEFVENPQVNFLSVHAPSPSSPLTTTTVVIQDLDDEDDSRQVSRTKGKDKSTSTTASQGGVLSDLPTTCYHLKGTSAKSAQNDSLKSSLSLSPASEDKGKTTSTLDSVSREQALPFTTTPAYYIPTTSLEGCSLHDCNKGSVSLSLDNSQAFTSTVMTHDLDHDDFYKYNHDIDILINHSLPKSRTRTNVVTAGTRPEVDCLEDVPPVGQG